MRLATAAARPQACELCVPFLKQQTNLLPQMLGQKPDAHIAHQLNARWATMKANFSKYLEESAPFPLSAALRGQIYEQESA